ncbi:U6 snRNA-associated Sm-like protein LSm6 [Nematocida sp. LUAm3]|nr:U6 snRNA-associated Sm-like protein LSm6 [Nematocida sp. LUAm3]KAI5175965.1 U6 snRNA-associated Sm-like protein LSm6 [Nematocida sp. LUAm2]KAI5179061.1 U6 snRNA-associated Sm-like protein LSm6 [Nematocida sp. LUAm1]
MREAEEFLQGKVLIATHSGVVFKGVLLGLDQYLNVTLQDISVVSDTETYYLPSALIKGSNVLHISLSTT